MSVQLTADLHRVRELLKAPSRWTTGVQARDSSGAPTDPLLEAATAFCLIGAVNRMVPDLDRHRDVMFALRHVCFALFRCGIVAVNDDLGHAGVLKALDAVIADAQRSTSAALSGGVHNDDI